MPRNYVKKKIQKYTQDDLLNAVTETKRDGTSIHAAAKKYSIPVTTLYEKVKETYSTNQVGRPLAIPLDQEERLANAIKVMEKWGFGLSRDELLDLVARYVKSNELNTPFTNDKPGKDWFINFRKRHRLSIKKPQAVEYVRKKMTDPFVISEYFKLLDDTLTDLNLHESPNLIWNLDETSLSLDPTKTKVVGAINNPCSRTTCGTGKENITVLTAVSASGEKATPLIIFKGKYIWDQWIATTNNHDFEIAYAATSRGWMETEVFKNYMEKMMIPALGDQRPALIIFDGHSTHVDVGVIELAIKNDVTILKLPPHTSHLLQPLDLAVLKSLKTKWDAELVEWQRRNVGTKMPKKVFAETFAKTWYDTKPEVIKSGFRKAGIHPFDDKVIPVEKYEPAAYRRYQVAQLNSKTPRPLKELCIDVINSTLELPKCLRSRNFQSKEKENAEKHTAEKANEEDDKKEMKNPKINKTSDIDVSFEELLLEKIRQEKKDNSTVKKTRVAKGAEVVTACDIKKIMEEKEENKKRQISKKRQKSTNKISRTQMKTRNSKGKTKLKITDAKPGPSGSKNSKQGNESYRKSNLRDSGSSSTSVSDIMSIYSELEFDYRDITNESWDEQIFGDNVIGENIPSLTSGHSNSSAPVATGSKPNLRQPKTNHRVTERRDNKSSGENIPSLTSGHSNSSAPVATESKPNLRQPKTNHRVTKRRDNKSSWYCPACEEDRVADMRQCLTCGIWFHELCVGLTPADITFYCSGNCLPKK